MEKKRGSKGNVRLNEYNRDMMRWEDNLLERSGVMRRNVEQNIEEDDASVIRLLVKVQQQKKKFFFVSPLSLPLVPAGYQTSVPRGRCQV